MTPCRVLDTRGGSPPSPPYGAPSLYHLAIREFQVAGACGVPAGALAISANATIVAPAGAGYLALWDGGATPWPGNSTLNYGAGAVLANAAIVPLSASGTINARAYVSAGSGLADFVLDVNGYYASTGIVNSLSGLSGSLTLAGSGTVTVTPSGSTITIGSTGGGTITGVTAGTGLAGGGAAGTVTLGIANGGVGTTQIADNNVTAPKIAAGQVVKDVNGARDSVVIQGVGGVSVTTAGSTISVSAPSGSMTLGPQGDTTLIGAGYTEVTPNVSQFWKPTSTTGAPPARYSAVAAWTGSVLLVWGGRDATTPTNTGGRYDPATDSWTATSTVNAPAGRYVHSGVWSGSRLIVWGGNIGGGATNTGGLYNPVGDSWSSTSLAGVPAPRHSHTAVWTGTTMIVWGGYETSGAGVLNSGGLYDPSGNSWTATSLTNAPSARFQHVGVWTGSKMVVWGGFDAVNNFNTGGVFDPSNGLWTATSTAGSPTARRLATALWTGSTMIVWGGQDSLGQLGSGSIYDPVWDTWTSTSTEGAPPARLGHSAVWTGSRMIIWGGRQFSYGTYIPIPTGGIYDPTANAWTSTPTQGAPEGRHQHTAVWTGNRMIVWGGTNVGSGTLTPIDTGGTLVPVSLYMKN